MTDFTPCAQLDRSGSHFGSLRGGRSQCYTPVHIPALPVRFKGDDDDVLRPEAKRAIHRLLAARIDIDAELSVPGLITLA